MYDEQDVRPLWVGRITTLHLVHICCRDLFDMTPIVVALCMLWNAVVNVTEWSVQALARVKPAPRYEFGNPRWIMEPDQEIALLRTFTSDGALHYEMWNVGTGNVFYMRADAAGKLCHMASPMLKSVDERPKLHVTHTFEKDSVTYHKIENVANGDIYCMPAYLKPFLRVLRTFTSSSAVHYEVLNTYSGETYCMRG